MTIARDQGMVDGWVNHRAIDLWVTPLDLHDVVVSAVGRTQVTVIARTSATFSVFEAMLAVGIDDVRRVGLVGDSTSLLEIGRRAGLGAVVGIADDPTTAHLLHAAEPDVVVGSDEFDALEATRYGGNRMMRARVLMNPGPALTTERVKRAAAGVDVCHRESEYVTFERKLRDKLMDVAGRPVGWSVALIAGSGTAADEMAIDAAVRPGRQLLVIRNGVYGDRFAQIAERAGIPTIAIYGDWTRPVDVDAVAAVLQTQHGIDALAVVHHETTTGVLNPISELAALARDAGVRVVVDAVSSFGAEQIELEGSGIDLLTCSSNKCLSGLPGAAFVYVSPAGRKRIAETPPRSVYLDLAAYLVATDTGVVPFTPAIPALRSLDAALDEVLEEGFARRLDRLAERAERLDAVLDGLGLEQLVEAGVAIGLECGRYDSRRESKYSVLHSRLKRDGYVIYAGQGHLAPDIFRVCCMGAMEIDVIDAFGRRLEAALAIAAVRA